MGWSEKLIERCNSWFSPKKLSGLRRTCPAPFCAVLDTLYPSADKKSVCARIKIVREKVLGEFPLGVEHWKKRTGRKAAASIKLRIPEVHRAPF